MMHDSFLLLVDLDNTGAFPAERLAAELGHVTVEKVRSVNEALTIFSRRSPQLRYVVVDIGLHGEDSLQSLAGLARACQGTIPLVVVGNVNDLGFYRAVKNLGAQEYFIHPVNLAEVRTAMVQQPGAPRVAMLERGATGKVMAFMSAASGDGSSTVALNIAHALADQTKQPAVLVDLDYQFGMVARQLDLQAPFGIRELFDYPERGVDATLVSKMLLPYGERLHVIAAPDLLRMKPAIRPETVRDLIQVLRSQYSYVLLDVPHIWAPWTAEALAQSDKIIVVSQLWLRSLTHLSRLLAAWGEAGINRDNIMLAINRSGARFREAITSQDFERVCLRSIDFHLPNDIKTVVHAENLGKTVMEIGASQLERQLREMAAQLAGKQHWTVKDVPAAQTKSGMFGKIFKQG